jgi:DNA gyrase/topoisomerase IV subunit A
MRDYPVSKLAENEWKDFALYSVESRAIPNMIDGLKPVGRFYLYSSLKNSKTEFKKVSAVSGVVSGYGYNHGETSAASAGQLMASEWCNNICLVEGRGSFGTRLVQEAAAPRYTYTRVHENFHKYIKDIDLAPEHSDPEHEPPSFYIPIIPLVLVNGVKGIATGFSTNILPRCPIDLTKACKEYIKTGKIKNKVKIKFPDFTGTVNYDDANSRYQCSGTFTRKGKTTVVITEVPYGFNREDYVKVLDALEDDGTIVSYEDQCDKHGFQFEVKLKQSFANDLTDQKITEVFKLSKPMPEHITVIDFEGKLRQYEDEKELIKDFCDYRMGVLLKRIALRKEQQNELLRWLMVKLQFVIAVIDDKIKFKNNNKNQISEQILKITDATSEDIDRLLRINIYSLTSEMVDSLINELDTAQKDLAYWTSTNEKEQFLKDLGEI